MKLEMPKDDVNGNTFFVEYDDFVDKVGSIYVSEKHGEGSRIATIVEASSEDGFYKIGDRILLNWYAGKRIDLPGKKLYGREIIPDRHRVVFESEVIARVIEED
jgi:hypothetical protein